MNGRHFSVSRRSLLVGGVAGGLASALAVPTLAAAPRWRWQYGSRSGLVHDAGLAAGRRFAAAAAAAGVASLAVEGDRVRFARALAAARPALMAGITRHADALMIADVAAEEGYVPAAELLGGPEGCSGNCAESGFVALTRLVVQAGACWPEVFGSWAADPQASAPLPDTAEAVPADGQLAIGWLLVPRN